MMNDSGVVDFTFLKVYAANNPTLMKNFIESFLEKTPIAIKQIEDDLAEGNFHSLSRSAHSLKPQLSYMGIKSAGDLIISIEEAAKNQTNTESIGPALDSLKGILESAYAELRTMSNEL